MHDRLALTAEPTFLVACHLGRMVQIDPALHLWVMQIHHDRPLWVMRIRHGRHETKMIFHDCHDHDHYHHHHHHHHETTTSLHGCF